MISQGYVAALLLLVAVLSGGCVSFETVPVAKTGCDAALVGMWWEPGEKRKEQPSDDELLRVSEDCAVSVLNNDGTVETRRFRTFELDGYRYVAVEGDEELVVTDSDDKTVETWPKTRVELYRYHLVDDDLLLWPADAAVAQTLGGDGVSMHSNATIDAKTGKPLRSTIQSSVYLSGERDDLAALLRKHGDALYQNMRPGHAIILRRATAKTAP